ncbi:MAG: signal peptidase I [Patescibacteria group bacterium]
MNIKKNIWEIIKFVVVALLIILPIRFWVVQPFIVSGSSMVPNFSNGDYLIIDEFSYHFISPRRGEVVILKFANEPYFIKRVVGLPGETVEIKAGRVYIHNNQYPEGLLLDESYLKDAPTYPDLKETLASDEYFVLGDNRISSADSRIWGSAKKDSIIGRTFIRLWPAKTIGVWPGSAN